MTISSSLITDTTPPSLISLTFPSIISLYGGWDRVVTFEANVFDALSGVSYVMISFDKTIATISPFSGDSWGGIHYVSFPFSSIYHGWDDSTPNNGTSDEIFLSINNPGTYSITSVDVRDLAGNSYSYTPTELHNLGIATSFEIIGSKADTTAPVLTKLTFPTTVDKSSGNQSINFEANAYDNGTGVDRVTINFDKNLDTNIGFGLSYFVISTDEWVDETPNYGIRNETILTTNTPGTYKITSVEVQDRVGNSTIYSPSDLKSMGIKTSFNISAALKINGTAGNDNLVGAESDDTLNALAGNDTLNGGLGADKMTGGLGNDTYYVDNNGDVVTETSAILTEIDNVISTITYTLGANVEKLTLTGAAAIKGTGNTLNNTLTGNTGANILNGLVGNDILNGGTGADKMTGGLGNDTYYVDNSGDVVIETSVLLTEIDTVNSSLTYTLGANIEKLTLTGAAVINGTGNALNNTLIGNATANILNGGVGLDTMIGGDGSDSYYVDNVGDVAKETNAVVSSGGTDLVYSYLSAYTLGANVENGRVLATGVANMTGNILNNIIYASNGVNSIDGLGGTDTLSYQFSTNTGVAGVILNLSVLNVSGQATASGISGADLIKGIENITGSNYNDNLTGNASANILSGLAGNDAINGGGGIDILVGGAGKDTLTGGLSNDIFDFNAYSEMGLGASARDVITDFVRGQDKIDLSNIDPAALAGDQAFKFITSAFNAPGQIHYSGGIISLNTDSDAASEYEIQLTGVIPAKLAATDFVL